MTDTTKAMDADAFHHYGHQLIAWLADYPEPFYEIFADCERVIMPGITYWQSPHWYAYFPANARRTAAWEWINGEAH